MSRLARIKCDREAPEHEAQHPARSEREHDDDPADGDHWSEATHRLHHLIDARRSMLDAGVPLPDHIPLRLALGLQGSPPG